MPFISVRAKNVLPGDHVKTADGYLRVGGVQELQGGKRIGLLTSQGMIGVDSDDFLTVKRSDGFTPDSTESEIDE